MANQGLTEEQILKLRELVASGTPLEEAQKQVALIPTRKEQAQIEASLPDRITEITPPEIIPQLKVDTTPLKAQVEAGLEFVSRITGVPVSELPPEAKVGAFAFAQKAELEKQRQKQLQTLSTPQEIFQKEAEKLGIKASIAQISAQRVKLAELKAKLDRLDLEEERALEAAENRFASMVGLEAAQRRVRSDFNRERANLAAIVSGEAAVLQAQLQNLELSRSLLEQSVNFALFDLKEEKQRIDDMFQIHSDWVNALSEDARNFLKERKRDLEKEEQEKKEKMRDSLDVVIQAARQGLDFSYLIPQIQRGEISTAEVVKKIVPELTKGEEETEIKQIEILGRIQNAVNQANQGNTALYNALPSELKAFVKIEPLNILGQPVLGADGKPILQYSINEPTQKQLEILSKTQTGEKPESIKPEVIGEKNISKRLQIGQQNLTNLILAASANGDSPEIIARDLWKLGFYSNFTTAKNIVDAVLGE